MLRTMFDQTSDFSVTEVQSEMVAAAEQSSRGQPEPQTSSIEVTDAAPGRTNLDTLTSKTSLTSINRDSFLLHEMELHGAA